MSQIFEPLDAVTKFCNNDVDASQLHLALYDIQSGINSDTVLSSGLNPIKTKRIKLGQYIRTLYESQVCEDEETVQIEIERVLSRSRDMSEDAKKLFGFARRETRERHCDVVTDMIGSNNMIWTPMDTNEPAMDVLGSSIDMEQVFHRIQHAQDNTQVWIFVESPFMVSKPHAVGVAAMAQTKVRFHFVVFNEVVLGILRIA